MTGLRVGRAVSLLAAVALISACATARMHSQEELNVASRGCGLTYGELIQDEEAKKLLILFRQAPAPAQRHCIYQWARKNHLKLVVIDAIQFPEQGE